MTPADFGVCLAYVATGILLAYAVSRVLLGLGVALLADPTDVRSELPRATGRLVATVALLVGAGMVLLLLDASPGQVEGGTAIERQARRMGLVLMGLALVLGIAAGRLSSIRRRAQWEREPPPIPGERGGATC